MQSIVQLKKQPPLTKDLKKKKLLSLPLELLKTSILMFHPIEHKRKYFRKDGNTFSISTDKREERRKM